METEDVPSTSKKDNYPPLPEKKNLKIQGGIQVSSRQRGNPILKSIRSVPWEFVEGLVPDYTLGTKICAFYLSVRYHTLHPDYIHERLKQMSKYYRICKMSEKNLPLFQNIGTKKYQFYSTSAHCIPSNHLIQVP